MHNSNSRNSALGGRKKPRFCQGHYPVLAFLYHRDRLLRWLTGITGSTPAHQGEVEGKECGVALGRAKVPPEKSKDFQGPT